jgi:ketosteroid isomerase-like protein
MQMPPVVREVFKTVDAKDAAGFAACLTPDAVFRYANAPMVTGPDAIRDAVAQFFAAVHSLRHELLAVWTQDDMVFCKGEVRYVRHDGSHAGPFPFVNLFRLSGDKIAEYLIYVDISPLFAPSPTH